MWRVGAWRPGVPGRSRFDGGHRLYERKACTNTFHSGSNSGPHTAILLGERKMTVDGRMYYWGEWDNMSA